MSPKRREDPGEAIALDSPAHIPSVVPGGHAGVPGHTGDVGAPGWRRGTWVMSSGPRQVPVGAARGFPIVKGGRALWPATECADTSGGPGDRRSCGQVGLGLPWRCHDVRAGL